MVIVTGTFNSSLEYFRFLQVFNQSELPKPEYTEQEPKINYLSPAIKITLTFKDEAEFLIAPYFKNGILKEWSRNFKIEDPLQATVKKYAEK